MKALFFTSGGIHVATMLGMARAYDLSDVDVVGGISAGAILASFIGSHVDPNAGLDEVESIILKQNLEPTHHVWNFIMSLLLNKSLYRDSFRVLLKSKLSSTKRTVFVGATDEKRLKYNLFEFSPGSTLDVSGTVSLDEACTASMSVPGAFPGVDVGSAHFVDGGLIHSLPIEAIEKTINLAESRNESLELVIFSALPWGWAPEQVHHRFLEIPHELVRILKSLDVINLYHDQRMLHSLLSSAEKRGVDVKLSTFMLPARIVNRIYHDYPPSSYSKCKTETFEHLIECGYDLVKTVLKHTDT